MVQTLVAICINHITMRSPKLAHCVPNTVEIDTVQHNDRTFLNVLLTENVAHISLTPLKTEYAMVGTLSSIAQCNSAPETCGLQASLHKMLPFSVMELIPSLHLIGTGDTEH